MECLCVKYLRDVLEVNIPFGDAITQKPNIPLKDVDKGDVLLMKYGGVYHVAEAIGFVGEQKYGTTTVAREIIVVESNYKECTPTVRHVPFKSKEIWGVYRPK